MSTVLRPGSASSYETRRTMAVVAWGWVSLSATALALLCPCLNANAQGVSFAAQTVAVGDENYGPTLAAVVDANGDGKLDLVVPSYGFRWGVPGDPGGWGNTLTLLTNNGTGNFASNATLTVGNGPCCVAAADLNNDDKMDVVSANQTDNTITVLTNTGSGFAHAATVPVGARPSFIQPLYIDDDCRLDLIVANAGDNSLTVLRNDGSGVFSSNATLAVGAEPVSLAVADLNGDGWTDVVSANNDANSLTVLTNDAAGTFSSGTNLSVGVNPDCVMVAHFDGDGKPDLVSVNWGDATMTVLTNNGSGVFGVKATLSVGNHPSTVAPADFDGDGSIDLICANTGTGQGDDSSLTVLTNNGQCVFAYCCTLFAGRIPNIAAADLDNDGKPDLACPNFRDGTVTVLRNTSSFPSPSEVPRLTIDQVGTHVRVTWPSATPGWSLQEDSDLQTPSWLPSGYAGYGIADDGENKSLALPCWMEQRFFRLLHP